MSVLAEQSFVNEDRCVAARTRSAERRGERRRWLAALHSEPIAWLPKLLADRPVCLASTCLLDIAREMPGVGAHKLARLGERALADAVNLARTLECADDRELAWLLAALLHTGALITPSPESDHGKVAHDLTAAIIHHRRMICDTTLPADAFGQADKHLYEALALATGERVASDGPREQRLPSAPFAQWLVDRRALLERDGMPSSIADMAWTLDLGEHHVRAVISGENATVSGADVDRALSRAGENGGFETIYRASQPTTLPYPMRVFVRRMRYYRGKCGNTHRPTIRLSCPTRHEETP